MALCTFPSTHVCCILPCSCGRRSAGSCSLRCSPSSWSCSACSASRQAPVPPAAVSPNTHPQPCPCGEHPSCRQEMLPLSCIFVPKQTACGMRGALCYNMPSTGVACTHCHVSPVQVAGWPLWILAGRPCDRDPGGAAAGDHRLYVARGGRAVRAAAGGDVAGGCRGARRARPGAYPLGNPLRPTGCTGTGWA